LPTCPRCSGVNSSLIAPGYYQCDSPIEHTAPTLGPQDEPILRHTTTSCGHRYHAGPTGTLVVCVCGTFAIGYCAECGVPVCGDHSETGPRRLCGSCITVRLQETADQQTALHRTRMAELASCRDPGERLVRAVRYFTKHSRSDYIGHQHYGDLWSLCSNMWPRGPKTVSCIGIFPNTPWIAGWFVNYAWAHRIAPPDHRLVMRPRPLVEETVWRFDGCSTVPRPRDAGNEDAFLLQNGQVVVRSHYHPDRSTAPTELLWQALILMGRMLNF
jgi:hypothetical protein